jgi:SAM-dependent methyltransferase
MQSNTDQKNAAFWNEPCGSHAATMLGVTDASPQSLKRYDDWYLNFYPYLLRHIPTHLMRGRSVLEVGLGYGTLSQQIVESGARYTGLDIAQRPVDLVNHRIKQTSKATGEAIQGSILEPRLEEETFDYVVAIGALHHTGDLAGAISRCRELLRPGGELRFMVYNAYSYRRFMQARHATIEYWKSERRGYRGVVGGEGRDRAIYDTNSAGEAAPHTDWISVTSLRAMCKDFSKFTVRRENIDQEPPFKKRKREDLLKTLWPRLCGLDLYATARK